MNKSKLQLAQSKLLLSVMSVAITLVMLTTSTYAWFATEQSATLSQMKVTADVDAAISFSAGDVDQDGNVYWTSSADTQLNMDNFINASANNSIPSGVVTNLSGAGNLVNNGGVLQFGLFQAEVDFGSDGRPRAFTSKLVDEPIGVSRELSFYAFDVYVYTAQDTMLCIKQQSIAYAVDTSKGFDYDLSNAVRVGFVYYGTYTGNSRDQAYEYAKGATLTQSAQTLVWEPNALSHNKDNSTKNGTLQQIYAIAGESDTPFSATTPSNKLNLMSANDNLVYTATNFTGDVPLFGIGAGVSKFRIYVWLEGQDGDCTDFSAGCTVSADIVLGIYEEDPSLSGGIGVVNFGIVRGSEEMGSPVASRLLLPLSTTVQNLQSTYVQAVTGYVFAGWYLDQDGRYPASSSQQIEANTTLFAKFEAR